MNVDQNSRDKLFQRQQTDTFNHTIVELKNLLKEQGDSKAQSVLIANFLIEMLTDLKQRIDGIGQKDLKELADSLKRNEINAEQYQQRLQQLVEGVQGNFNVFKEIKDKLDAGQKDMEVSGKVDVGSIEKLPPIELKNPIIIPKFPDTISVKNKVAISSIDSLPPIRISNFEEMQQFFAHFQEVTLTTIRSLQTKFPDSFQVNNQVQIKDWSELLDAMEELKKGFNILISKTGEASGQSTDPQKVEVTNFMQLTPQPVTNININPLRGYVATTAVTVGPTAVPLPGTSLANRRSLVVYNNSSTITMYVGGSNVTNLNGMPVPPSSYSPAFDNGPRMIVYGITASGSIDVRVMELSGDDMGGNN